MKAFVASAIGHLSEEELRTDTAFVRKLMETLEGVFGKDTVFCALEQFPEPSEYPPPSKALDIVLQALVQTRFFFLYFPRRVYSGALVELGYAMAYGKPTLILTETKSVLPYMMQDESDLMGICELRSRSFEEIVPRIQAFVKKWS